jgi:peroxiredoxin
MPDDNPYAAIALVMAEVRDSDAPLNERLRKLAQAVNAGSPIFAAAVDRVIARLSAAGGGAAAPGLGESLPPFLLPDAAGRLVSLSDILERGPAVISFYRGHWCPYCQLTAATAARLQTRIGPEHMVAITPETPAYNRDLAAQAGIGYPVLTDLDCGYALSLNLAFWVDNAFADLMRGVGNDLALFQASAGWFLPIPATFVVDSRSVIVARHINPDYRRRMEVDDLLAAFESAD